MEKRLPTLKEIEGKYEPEELKDLTDEEVLKVFEGVETVWDYNPTEEVFLIDLYSLFVIREEEKRAEKYFNQLSKDVQQSIIESSIHGY